MSSSRPVTQDEIAADYVLQGLVRDGMELTRENYIERCYPEGLPEPWTAELEGDLPESLQDWSKFEAAERPDF